MLIDLKVTILRVFSTLCPLCKGCLGGWCYLFAVMNRHTGVIVRVFKVMGDFLSKVDHKDNNKFMVETSKFLEC